MKATILVVGGERTHIKQIALRCIMQGHEVEIEDNDYKEYERIIYALNAKVAIKNKQ